MASSSLSLSSSAAALSASGFYLRHGYVEGEMSFMSFPSLFSRSSGAVERLTRDPVRRALHAVGGSAASNAAVPEKSPSEAIGCGATSNGGGAPPSALTALLATVADSMDPSTEGQDMFNFLAAEAQKLWRLSDDNSDNAAAGSTSSAELSNYNILFKATVPAERARDWRELCESSSSSEEKETESTPAITNADADAAASAEETAVVVAASDDNACLTQVPDGLQPTEVRTTVCGVATVDPAFVTITVSDGQGMRAWLWCCSIYAHNELERMKRAAIYDVKAKIQTEADREARKRTREHKEALEAAKAELAAAQQQQTDAEAEDGVGEGNKERVKALAALTAAFDEAERSERAAVQLRIDAAVKEALEAFTVPPRPPLMLTAYIKSREQRTLHTSDVLSERFVPTRSNLISLQLIEKLFCGGGSLSSAFVNTSSSTMASPPPPIVLRNTKNDNLLVLPSPLDTAVRVSWASLVSQVRHAWRVQRPYFQYVLREGGSFNLVTITDAEQFAQWKRQLSGAVLATSSSTPSSSPIAGAKALVPFELRVFEHAAEKDIVAEPLPKPIQLGAMLALQPPFFLSTGAATRGTMPLSTIEDRLTQRSSAGNSSSSRLEDRAVASAKATMQNSHKQLHSCLSLEAAHIVSRIEGYQQTDGAVGGYGANFVTTWDRVGLEEERQQRMGSYYEKHGLSGTAAASTASTIPRPPQGSSTAKHGRPSALGGGGSSTAPSPTSSTVALNHAADDGLPPSDHNEARQLAAAHRQKLKALLGSDADASPSQYSGTTTPTLPPIQQQQGSVRNAGSVVDALPANSPMKSRAALASSSAALRSLTATDITSPYRVALVSSNVAHTNDNHSNNSMSASAGGYGTSMNHSSLAYSLGYGVSGGGVAGPTIMADPFGPKYTIPSLVSPSSPNRAQSRGGGGMGSDGLTPAQRHLQRLTKNAQLATTAK